MLLSRQVVPATGSSRQLTTVVHVRTSSLSAGRRTAGAAVAALELRRALNPPRRLVTAAASSAVPAPDDQSPSEAPERPGRSYLAWLLFAVVTAAMAALFGSGHADGIKTFLVDGPLGQSGFLAAFAVIFLSEIGDKTFFIAALLAMKLGRWISFWGSLIALSIMTLISVAIGVLFSKLPDSLASTMPVGEIAGCALLVFFGLRALRDAAAAKEGADEEMADAESAVKEAESSGRVGRRSLAASLLEVGTLIFLAEWGDRSMLMTVGLGAAKNAVGVAIGAIIGHAVATCIAVVGGAIAAKYVSEKTMNLTSGIMFLLFAATTAFHLIA